MPLQLACRAVRSRGGGGVRYIWDTPGMVEDLKAILEQGATAGEAASILKRTWGVHVSRSAVIGKAYRLGFELRSQGCRSEALGKIARKVRGPNKHPQPPKPAPIPRMPIMVDEPQPLGDVDGGCRYLHGDATLRAFCGHGTWPLSPWCDFHRRRVWAMHRAALVETDHAA